MKWLTFVRVSAASIDVIDSLRGLLLGQLVRTGSGRRWKADRRLRKRLGVPGGAGSLAQAKGVAAQAFAALDEAAPDPPPWLRENVQRQGGGRPSADVGRKFNPAFGRRRAA